MPGPDLNLLYTLDALLSEGSVAGAARRLRLSPSAMSRALARLRQTTGDPLLVRSGRGLVATPRALELRQRMELLVAEAQAVLRPVEKLDLAQLERVFTLRTGDGFVDTFGAALIARITAQAPGVRLRFVGKSERGQALLRHGDVDLETGVVSATDGPEMRTMALFHDRFVGVVRHGHPLATGEITAERYAEGGHVLVSRRGQERGLVDDALAALGLQRRIVAMVGGFSAALALVRASDLVTAVPERHTTVPRAGLHTFPLPVSLVPLTVSMLWHPRLDADAGHRWLRDCVRAVCGSGENQP